MNPVTPLCVNCIFRKVGQIDRKIVWQIYGGRSNEGVTG